MAKGGRRKGQNRNQRRPQQRRQRASPPHSPQTEIKNLHEEAAAAVTEEEKAALKDDTKPESTDIGDMLKLAQQARELFNAAKTRYDGQLKELADQCDAVEKTKLEVEERRSTLDADESALAERKRQLGEKEVSIKEREDDAEFGFEKKRTEMLDRYNKEIADRGQALEAREGELDTREDELKKRERELDSKGRDLRWHEEDIQEQQSDLDSRVVREVAKKQEQFAHQLASATAQLEQARHDRDQHAKALQQREEADRRFGQRSPDQVLREIEELRVANKALHGELARRPDVDATQRLDSLSQEQQAWQAERLDLTRQVSKLERRLAYADRDASDREVQRDLIESLRSQRELLYKANDEMRTEVRELIGRADSRSPFPACINIDEDQEHQRDGRTKDIGNLQQLAENIRQRIAYDDELYYSEADIRSFIGGLAMGRLILLQGISGTGKTSLPLAFARAVGTKASVIEVQAGWRDPQDLVGHYNAFEKRFYEKEFLKALYRAGTPRWQDTIQIVLLDEMNLSYPEQYFSDMLSALELDREEQRLTLMTHSVESAPARFEDGGWLPIAPNVWFVGTANHDETTMDFADKTYDRSHVMEFPHRPETFKAKRPEPQRPVSFSAFQDAIESAVEKRAEEAKHVREHFEYNLRRPLADHFEIGWGPRLDRQMARYVPVVREAGGTVGEAADHLLVMRLLRKLKSRHNNRPEHLEALKQAIEGSWLDDESPPAKSIKLLDAELGRLGRDVENEA